MKSIEGACRLTLLVATLAVVVLAGAAGCKKSEDPDDSGVTADDICLLNYCESDAHCTSCEEGRNYCDTEENQCIACDEAAGHDCPAGEACTDHGLCVPDGLECPTDGNDEPAVTCTSGEDCLACDLLHQVCDATSSQCVGCTAEDTSHCPAGDVCVDGACTHTCPETCTTDSECGDCEAGHACYQHLCAECSDTTPCTGDQTCSNGTCVNTCGMAGAAHGVCEDAQDCAGCGGASTTDPWVCDIPVDSDRGVCTAPPDFCDAPDSSIVLPPPYDQTTTTCETDQDCIDAGASVPIDVGLMTRDLLGSDEIDLGFTTIAIADVPVDYPMHSCADVTVATSTCGLCTPCEVDADCAPIDIDPLASDLFADDPFQTIASALLFDTLWGDAEDHHYNYWCQPIAAGYGACIPCGNPLIACGESSQTGSGSCDHDVDTPGGPLDPTCGPCEAAVCAQDPYCCTTEWDAVCVAEVAQLCGALDCIDDPCTMEGPAQDRGCSDCVNAICTYDPYCCDTATGAWDSFCVGVTSDPAFSALCAMDCP